MAASLEKSERKKIFSLFAKNPLLKFSEIERAIKIRSNMVSYHLEQLQKNGLVEKKGFFYRLTSFGESLIPEFSNIGSKKLSPLPIVLAAIMHNEKILMIRRSNRPYRGYWALIGGKMLIHERFEDSAKRLAKAKTGIDISFEGLRWIMHEQVKDDNLGKVKHSFFLFFTKAVALQEKTKASDYGELRWFSVEELDNELVVPSDLWLIKNKMEERCVVSKGVIVDADEMLSGFETAKIDSQ